MKEEIRQLTNLTPDSPLGQQWESLAQRNPAGGFMQSLHWADFKRRQGLNTLHFGIFRDDTMAGGVIFYGASNANGNGLLIAPEGPLLDWGDSQTARRQLNELVRTVKSTGGTTPAMALRIEPRISPSDSALPPEFGRAPVDLLPCETLYVDISGTHQDILARMKPKGRYNIRLSERRGVEIHCAEDPLAAVDDLYGILRQAALRDGFFLEPKSFFHQLAESLCPAGLARIYFARYKGTLLGGMFLVTYGDRATYLYGGTTNSFRSLMGGYLLQWAAMKAAAASGCSTYDFYGYDQFRTRDNAYSRFSQFKSRFGGQAVRFIGGHDVYFMDRLADAVIQAINEIPQDFAHPATGAAV